jgi:NAD(P)H-hydrate epimerase
MYPLEGQKVVTAQEMSRMEKNAYAKGCSEAEFMETAGTKVAEIVAEFIEENGLEKQVILFVGKGNNGGDAYVAGIKLLAKGFAVQAFHFFPLENCSPLCVKQHGRFQATGRKIHYAKEAESFCFSEGIILDGLVGTGFSGKAEGILAKAIEQANQSELPILAIDIPSGVDGNDGSVETVAIQAIKTIYLGLPKWGFFTKEGWNHVGQLVGANFGLPEEEINKAQAKAFLYNSEVLPLLLPPLKRNRHKYDAGYVLGIAGSASMPGAALLSSYAALRAGAGIVRLFYPEGAEQEMAAGAPLELIKESWDLKNFERILEESKRARAFFVGPGIGRTKMAKKMLSNLLQHISIVTIFDADALYFIAEEPEWHLPRQSILTPHVMEMKRLLKSEKELNLEACQQYAEAKNITIVLKGAPTFIFHPQTLPLIMTRGDPGMATAGTGDVLTGILAALLAQNMPPREAAFLGTYLHAVAGEIAAHQLTSYGVIASDLIEYLPEAFWEILLSYP